MDTGKPSFIDDIDSSGKKTKTTIYKSKTGKVEAIDTYDKDCILKTSANHDPSTGNPISISTFETDKKTFANQKTSKIEYDPKNGIKKGETEFDPSTDKRVSASTFDKDGKKTSTY